MKPGQVSPKWLSRNEALEIKGQASRRAEVACAVTGLDPAFWPIDNIAIFESFSA